MRSGTWSSRGDTASFGVSAEPPASRLRGDGDAIGSGQKINADICLRLLVGEGGFEPPKSVTTDLQSAPFGRSGIPPYEIVELVDGFEPPTC